MRRRTSWLQWLRLAEGGGPETSADGRHLATMPHIERSIFPWNWAHYPNDRQDEVSPWMQAFVNARDWLVGEGK